MAAAYAVAGWVLIEVADTVTPLLLLPELIPRAVVVLVILGSPVALLLAWAYDITPEGLQRTPPRGPLQPASTSGGSGAGTSLAVLPFVSMDPGNEDAAFSDGLSEEILNALAGVDG